MPDTIPVLDKPRRLSPRFERLSAVGASARRLLRRLLLGSDGAFVCGRGDECSLDRTARAAYPFGESYPRRTLDRARRRSCLCSDGRLDAAFLADITKHCWMSVKCKADIGIVFGYS
jgi:hypothetical protein